MNKHIDDIITGKAEEKRNGSDTVVRCPRCLRDLPENWNGRCFPCEDRAMEELRGDCNPNKIKGKKRTKEHDEKAT